MKPILFAPGTVSFNNNGLGRLNDTLTIKVTEELDAGVYECDFTYPVTGVLFESIQVGSIIGTTHDSTGDVQPFDVVGYTKPIDGIVAFHCAHISYRLTRYIAKPDKSRTYTNFAAITTLFDNAAPHDIIGRFWYSWPGLDEKTAVLTAATDGMPRSVRQYIGGIEGSVIDVFRCEVVWDGFNVRFVPRRGSTKSFTVRYGVNLTNYEEEADGQGTYTKAVAVWSKNDETVITEAESGLAYYDHPAAVVLDLTSEFDTKPTTAELEEAAIDYMRRNQTNIPTRSIEVEFANLNDIDGGSNLYKCALGDSIKVVFPKYNFSGTFRIVRTVWDPLTGHYVGMTLGKLATTLAQALGVGGGTTISGSGSSGVGSVVVTPTLTSGTKLADIDVDGTVSEIYAPTVSVSQTLPSGTKIADISVGGTTTELYAPGSSTATAEAISNFTSQNATFTPTRNGVVTFCYRASANAAVVGIQDTTITRYVAQNTITSANYYATVTFPVVAGHVYKILTLTNATSIVPTVVYF